MVASFNHWFPVLMDTSVKKMIHIRDKKAIKDKVEWVKQRILNADIPANIKSRHARSKSKLAKV